MLFCSRRSTSEGVRITSKPESQNCPKERSGCLSVGSTVAVVAWVGRFGLRCWRLRVAEWVDDMVPPSGVRTMMLFCACVLSLQIVSAQMKCDVQPESAQPTWDVLFLLLVAVDDNI